MARKHDNTFRPQLENLEARRVPAAVSLSHGVLTINGTDAADTAVVTQAHGRITVQLSGGVTEVDSFKKSDVRLIVFNGGAGDDVFVNLTSVRALALGGPGNDVLIGGTNNDILIGGPGNDVIIGRAGNDVLEGDDGNDLLMDDRGRDVIMPGPGENEVHDHRGDRVEREDGMDNIMEDQDHGDNNGMDVHHDGMDNSGDLSSDHGGH